MIAEEYYPEWLGSDLIDADFPWEKGLRTTFIHFLEQYTLHDSYWIGLYLEPQRSGLMIIRWDTFWTDGRVPFPGSKVAEWPFLLVKLSGVRNANIGIEESGIAVAESIQASDEERQGFSLSSGSVYHLTKVEDHAGGIARVSHEPDVVFLCLDRGRKVLEIPF